MTTKVLFDDAFLSLANSGIAHYWKQIIKSIEEYSLCEKYDINFQIVNRSRQFDKNTFDLIDFIGLDINRLSSDIEMLNKLVQYAKPDIFLSTYYTYIPGVKSLGIIYDLIPEVLEFESEEYIWQHRENYFHQFCNNVVISEATLRDLKLFYPFKKEERFWVIRPGVDHNVFRRSESEKIQKFRAKYDLGNKSFVMFVGARHQKNDYKNSVKFFEALNSEKTFKYNVVCVGGEELLESEIKICTKAGIKLHRLEVLDEELPICYSAATCLVYPSKYEGFGMPVLEALSVGTAVVSGKRGGLIESGGELITPVDVENGNDILRGIELAAASNWASHILKEGPKWAAKFSWKESAELLIKAILTTKESYESLRVRKANEILFDFHSAMKYLE